MKCPIAPSATNTATFTPVPTATGTATSTAPPTVTATPLATLTPSPTTLPTSSPTPAPTTTPTPTSSPTATPTPLPLASPTVTPTLPLTLTLSTAPQFVTPGHTFTLFWEIGNWDTLPPTDVSLELVIRVPQGFAPQGNYEGVFDPVGSTLTLQAQVSQDHVRWSISDESFGPYALQADLLLDGQPLVSAMLTIEEQDVFVITQSGGQAAGFDGRVVVDFPPGAVNETVEVRVQTPGEASAPPTSLSGNPFRLTAHSQESGEEITQFNKPISSTRPNTPSFAGMPWCEWNLPTDW